MTDDLEKLIDGFVKEWVRGFKNKRPDLSDSTIRKLFVAHLAREIRGSSKRGED